MKEFIEYFEKEGQLRDGGLLGINIVILQGILSINPIDISLTFAIIALSIAIPAITFTILTRNLLNSVSSINSIKEPFYYAIFRYTGWISAIVAIDATIWHVFWVAGIVFICISFSAYAVYNNFFDKVANIYLKEAKKKLRDTLEDLKPSEYS